MAKRRRLSVARLRSILSYDPETGVFRWKVRTAYCTVVGEVAGSTSGAGYAKIQIDGVTWQGHRLAWLYMRGRLPRQIDHENLVKSDNRFSNLRAATGSENTANQPKRKDTSSRFKGVTWNKNCGRWQASIKVRGRNLYLGLFDEERPAHNAYVAAARQHFGEFARAA